MIDNLHIMIIYILSYHFCIFLCSTHKFFIKKLNSSVTKKDTAYLITYLLKNLLI